MCRYQRRNEGAQAIRRDMTKNHQHPLEKILESRIAIIDGAMGTTNPHLWNEGGGHPWRALQGLDEGFAE